MNHYNEYPLTKFLFSVVRERSRRYTIQFSFVLQISCCHHIRMSIVGYQSLMIFEKTKSFEIRQWYFNLIQQDGSRFFILSYAFAGGLKNMVCLGVGHMEM